MHARLIRLDDLEARTIPRFDVAPMSTLVSVDDVGTRGTALACWTDEADARRAQLVTKIGEPNAGRLMEVAAERWRAVPRDLAGATHRLVTVCMNIDDVGLQVVYFRVRVIPENLLSAAGFLGVRFLVDRTTGIGVVSTIWRDRAVTQAVDALGSGRRERGLTRGIAISPPTYETVLTATSEHGRTGPRRR